MAAASLVRRKGAFFVTTSPGRHHQLHHRSYSSISNARRSRIIKGRSVNPEAPLAGSVKKYDRHILVLDPLRGHELWPSHVEESGFLLVKHYLDAYKSNFKDRSEGTFKKLKFTIAEAISNPLAAPHDDQDPATSFPNQHSAIVYDPEQKGFLLRGLKKDDIPSLVHLWTTEKDIATSLLGASAGRRIADHINTQALKGTDIFVCAHATRDIKCKACGPKLIDWLQQAVDERKRAVATGEEEAVRIWPTSHVGGHRFGANALTYPSGDWFGYINSSEEARLLLAGLSNSNKAIPSSSESSPSVPLVSKVLRKNWRGRMGMTEAEQERLMGQSSL